MTQLGAVAAAVDGLHQFEKEQIAELKVNFSRDIALALSNFKVWLLLSILSNIVLIGLPALYVFFSTTNVAQTALALATESSHRLNERANFISRTDNRLTNVEAYLQAHGGFVPATPKESLN